MPKLLDQSEIHHHPWNMYSDLENKETGQQQVENAERLRARIREDIPEILDYMPGIDKLLGYMGRHELESVIEAYSQGGTAVQSLVADNIPYIVSVIRTNSHNFETNELAGLFSLAAQCRFPETEGSDWTSNGLDRDSQLVGTLIRLHRALLIDEFVSSMKRYLGDENFTCIWRNLDGR